MPQGRSVADAICAIEVTWLALAAGARCLKLDQVKRKKEREMQDARLHRTASSIALDKLIPREAASGSGQVPRAGGIMHAERRRAVRIRLAGSSP